MSKTYKYDPLEDKPIFDSEGKVLQSIPSTRDKKIYNKDGLLLSKITLKIPQKRGFGNEQHASKRNTLGRPVGSKTKNSFKDAIKRFKSNQLVAAQLIVAVMNGDEVFVGCEIKLSERLSAAKYVIEAPTKMKENPTTVPKPESSEEGEQVKKPVPLVSLTQA